VGPEGVPRDCGPCLRDPEVCPVDGHQAVIVDIAFLALFEVDLQCIEERRGRRGQGGLEDVSTHNVEGEGVTHRTGTGSIGAANNQRIERVGRDGWSAYGSKYNTYHTTINSPPRARDQRRPQCRPIPIFGRSLDRQLHLTHRLLHTPELAEGRLS
jgi:hypothetical protein